MDDSKRLLGKWLFHQTSIKKWLVRVSRCEIWVPKQRKKTLSPSSAERNCRVQNCKRGLPQPQAMKRRPYIVCKKCKCNFLRIEMPFTNKHQTSWQYEATDIDCEITKAQQANTFGNKKCTFGVTKKYRRCLSYHHLSCALHPTTEHFSRSLSTNCGNITLSFPDWDILDQSLDAP